MFEDYLQHRPQYDTINDYQIFESETEFVPRQNLRKLSKDVKSTLKDIKI